MTTIGIIIGIILGIVLSYSLIQVIQINLNNLADKWVSLKLGKNYFDIVSDGIVQAKLNISIPMIFLEIIIIYLVAFISSLLPMRKINKSNQIDTIRNANNIKIKTKTIKNSKTISRIFREEGVLAYKNIRREKAKYRTIVISLASSIILFLVISSLITNMFQETNDLLKENKYDYSISSIKQNEIDEIIDLLNKDNLIKEYTAYATALTYNKINNIIIPENKISKSMKKAINSGVDLTIQSSILSDGSLKMSTYLQYVIGTSYKEILKRAGIQELKQGEVIISNTINIENSKYGDKIKYTDFKMRRYCDI